MVRFSPKQPVGQLAAQAGLPGVEVLALEGVDGLLVAAVVLGVPDEVPDQAAAEPAALGPGGPDLHRAGRPGRLPIPVDFAVLYGFGSARPTLTESSWPTGSA